MPVAERGRTLTPVHGRTCPLADTAEGVWYTGTGHARGNAVVAVTWDGTATPAQVNRA